VAQLFSLGHFTMRYTIPILFVAATLLAGCQSPPVPGGFQPTAAPPPFQPLLITTTGTNTTSDGAWQIVVSNPRLDFSHSRGSGWTTPSFPYPTGMIGTNTGWTTHTGWFVFVESDFRVWAYDGDRLLMLHTYTPDGNGAAMRSYISPRLPCAVPADVFSRLSEPAQKVIQSHD